jgi:ubiquitin carboxyl-terminal hydrolase 5/13
MEDDGMEEESPGDGGGALEAPDVQSRGSDGQGQYELLGFVSHIGKSVTSGHYVCHIKKDGQWLLFNDEKVELCADPPLECGYLYFYISV